VLTLILNPLLIRRFWPNQRRGWDLNPRTALRRSAVFKTAPFDRSGTPPGAKGTAPPSGALCDAYRRFRKKKPRSDRYRDR
jgi:hypothetical protein